MWPAQPIPRPAACSPYSSQAALGLWHLDGLLVARSLVLGKMPGPEVILPDYPAPGLFRLHFLLQHYCPRSWPMCPWKLSLAFWHLPQVPLDGLLLQVLFEVVLGKPRPSNDQALHNAPVHMSEHCLQHAVHSSQQGGAGQALYGVLVNMPQHCLQHTEHSS